MDQNDDNLERLKARYEEALHRNKEAKLRYENLAKAKVMPRNAPYRAGKDVTSMSESFFDTHLELLRLRRQNEQLEILSDYVDKAEEMANRNLLFDRTRPDAILSVSSERPQENESDKKLENLLEQAKGLTYNLELALVEARQQLKREQALLDDIKTKSPDDVTAITPAAKARALLATKEELTAWIEDTLAKCDEPLDEVDDEQEVDHPTDFSSQKHALDELRAQTNTLYEQYLHTRQEALNTAESLKHSYIPSKAPKESVKHQAPTHIRNGSRTNVLVPHEKTINNESSLATIESQYLPKAIQREILSQHTEHLTSQLSYSQHMLLETLHRLRDESHLLPSYPILAQDARFKHATDALRGHPMASASPSKQRDSKLPEDEISALLDAWSFASEAARNTTKDTVQKNVDAGLEALDRADHSMSTMQETHSTWKQALGKITERG